MDISRKYWLREYAFALRFTALQETVVAMHSYDLPEIILLPIQAGLPAYLNWISATMQP